MRPPASTAVASIIRSPAPDTDRLPRCSTCQSVALPSTALYWHIGAIAMRLARVRPRKVIGWKSWLGMKRSYRDDIGGELSAKSSGADVALQCSHRATLPSDIRRRGAGQKRVKESGSSMADEADLYQPVKLFLEGQGYDVKGEVRGCDVVARRGDEKLLIVELKLRFNLQLVLQGVERLALTDQVYLAVPRAVGRRVSPVAGRR